MCGLFSFRKSSEEARWYFNYEETPDFPPRTYVAPQGPIAIISAGASRPVPESRPHAGGVIIGVIPILRPSFVS